MSDPDRLTEIRQRRAVIAPVPWVQQNAMSNRWTVLAADGQTVVSANAARFTGDADAEFIAHAPDDIDWLLDEVEQARRDRDNMHQDVMRLQDKVGFAIEREQQARAEVERLRERLRGYEGHRAYSTCRICGEPIERFRNIWYHETTRDHDAEPTAEIRST